MRGIKTRKKDISIMEKMRTVGCTLSEIQKVVPLSKATIYTYIKDVKVKDKFIPILEAKKIGSKYLSSQEWKKAKVKAKEILNPAKSYFNPIVLACLYWGEGNKRDLNLINSDPNLLKIFVKCLYSIGVCKKDLILTIRVYEDNNIKKSKIFWSKVLGTPMSYIKSVNVLDGKKEGKLKYGMCRVRVRKGGKYFKLIMSMIDFLKRDYNAAVVQWIEQGTPKP